MVRNNRDPFDPEALSRVRQNLVTRSELRERALDAIEIGAKRGMAAHDAAEEATRMVHDGGYFTGNNVARHILETGSRRSTTTRSSSTSGTRTTWRPAPP